MPVKDNRKCILKQSKINQIFVFCQGKVETNYFVGSFLDFSVFTSEENHYSEFLNSIFVIAKLTEQRLSCSGLYDRKDIF